jgi:hypothetical protein
MTLTIIGFLTGAALALRFKVWILFPVIGLALLGAAAVGIGRGDRIASVVLTVVLLGSALQIGYLASIMTRAVSASIRLLNTETPRAFALAGGPLSFSGFKSLDVQDHMEVVGSDGEHVGTVDHKESAEEIILTKDDPNAGGLPHLISLKWVDYVDAKIHLNKSSKKAMVEWLVAARASSSVRFGAA